MTTLFPILIPHSYAFMTDFLQDNEPSIGHPNSHQHPINLLRIKKFLKTPPPHSQLPPLTPTQSSIMLFVDSNIKDISATSPLPHTFPYRSFTSLSPSLLGSTPFLFPQGLLLPYAKLQYQSTALSPFDLQPQSSTLPLHSISTPMVSRTTPQDGVSTSIVSS
jgi:hypothetical protein